MTKNSRGKKKIPHSMNPWVVFLMAVAALATGAILIVTGTATVTEAVVYTSPAWALLGVRGVVRTVPDQENE